MYILNISFMVEHPVHTQWMDVMQRNFIPFVQTEGFDPLVFTRILSNDNNDGFTYSLQIPIADMSEYERFGASVMSEYLNIANDIFGEKVVHFSTLLKKICI